MLSSRSNTDRDQDSDESESPMPGDYEPWSATVSRVASRTRIPSRQSSVPPSSRPSSQPPRARNLATEPKLWPPVTPDTSPVGSHRRRRRPNTPEVIIKRQYHRHHRSSERNRIITIPLDYRPTLGMRAPPKKVLEIERVRCHRRRKHRPCCYEIDYGIPPPLALQPQSNFIYTDPLPNPYLSPAQPSIIMPTNNSATWLTTFSNLTPQMIENLPKRTVHLPPIYLPGSQADVNTELETVLFPAEIINPIDGTLSIIQTDSAASFDGTAVFQSPAAFPVQPQFINAPAPVQSPMTMLTMASGPFMQQVQDLFQRITLSQPQPISSPYNRLSMPVAPQYNTAMNSFYNPQPIPPNSGPYRTTTFTPVYSANTTAYPPANITPYHPITSTQYSAVNNRIYQPASIAPYSPANITSYTPSNPTLYSPANIPRYASSNPTLYRPANITPYQPIISNSTPFNPTHSVSFGNVDVTPSDFSDIGPYQPANITPYQPMISNSTPFHATHSTSFGDVDGSPSDFSDIGPYQPANITPYQPMISNSTPFHATHSTSFGDVDGSPSDFSDIGPYQPANITPYQPMISNSTPFNSTHSASFRDIGITPSDSLDIGPYQPANITPYNAGPYQSNDSSMWLPPVPSTSMPYTESSSLTSSTFFNTSPSALYNRPFRVSHTSPSSVHTLYQSNTPMPKSILRNGSSNRSLNTTYTRFNPSNVLSSNRVVREMATVV